MAEVAELDRETETSEAEQAMAEARAVAVTTWIDDVMKAEAKVRAAELELESAKAEQKECKAAFDAAVVELRRTIREKDQPTLPFPDKPQGEDAWRSIPLAEALIGLPLGVYEKLREAEIATMGEYSDFAQKVAASGFEGEHPLQKIKGLGPAKIEQIEAAEAAFWERQRAQGVTLEAESDPSDVLDEDDDTEDEE